MKTLISKITAQDLIIIAMLGIILTASANALLSM